jgi:MFS transporter, PPP family, 3-phenylpropionic acid transporter
LKDRSAAAFLSLYAVTYMPMVLFGTFFPVYFASRGFSQAAIGLLFSAGPFVALVAQPAWGALADRAASRATVLSIALGGSALSCLLFLAGVTLPAAFAVMVLFLFFQLGVSPIMDAITIEHLEARGRAFGPIRVAGTVGYAVMAVLGGMLVQRSLSLQFPATALLYGIAAAVAFLLPRARRRPAERTRPRPAELLRNRELVLVLSFVAVICATTFYNMIFFPVYFTSLGGTPTLLGWATLAATLPEIPMLLVADRLMRRFKIQGVVAGAGLLMALRWLLISVVKDPVLLVPVQALHGMTFVVVLVATAVHVSGAVGSELKASAQALNALLVSGVGRILGGVVGGLVGGSIGMQAMYRVNAGIALAAVLAFGAVYTVRAKRPRRSATPG